MRRVLWWAIGLVVAIAVLGALILRSPAVQDAVVRRMVARAVAASADDLFREDALRVALCGTASPLPHRSRAKACVAVFAAGRCWIVDAGPGSWNRLALWNVDGKRIGAVFLTHFHSDHIGELGEINLQTWVAGRRDPLRVFGPPGVERVVAGFSQAYALDTRFRIAHHGADFLQEATSHMRAKAIVAHEDDEPALVLDEGGLRISAFPVDHRPVVPAYGYRFDYRGRSVVVSGDTAESASLTAVAHGADVLVHEAQAKHLVTEIEHAAASIGRDRVAKIMHDIQSYHTTPTDAAEVANVAGVRLLVFTHLNPPPPNRIAEYVFVRGVAQVRPDNWILGDDGLVVELPAGSDALTVTKLED